MTEGHLGVRALRHQRLPVGRDLGDHRGGAAEGVRPARHGPQRRQDRRRRLLAGHSPGFGAPVPESARSLLAYGRDRRPIVAENQRRSALPEPASAASTPAAPEKTTPSAPCACAAKPRRAAGSVGGSLRSSGKSTAVAPLRSSSSAKGSAQRERRQRERAFPGAQPRRHKFPWSQAHREVRETINAATDVLDDRRLSESAPSCYTTRMRYPPGDLDAVLEDLAYLSHAAETHPDSRRVLVGVPDQPDWPKIAVEWHDEDADDQDWMISTTLGNHIWIVPRDGLDRDVLQHLLEWGFELTAALVAMRDACARVLDEVNRRDLDAMCAAIVRARHVLDRG